MSSVHVKEYYDSVELDFEPPVTIPEFIKIPLPNDTHIASYKVLNAFPEYGNTRIRILNEVFVRENPEEYAERVAKFLGRTIKRSQ